MEAASLAKMSASVYQTPQRHMPEDVVVLPTAVTPAPHPNVGVQTLCRVPSPAHDNVCRKPSEPVTVRGLWVVATNVSVTDRRPHVCTPQLALRDTHW
jgi:hypothetical protein